MINSHIHVHNQVMLAGHYTVTEPHYFYTCSGARLGLQCSAPWEDGEVGVSGDGFESNLHTHLHSLFL